MGLLLKKENFIVIGVNGCLKHPIFITQNIYNRHEDGEKYKKVFVVYLLYKFEGSITLENGV